jgi:hypothetical protein
MKLTDMARVAGLTAGAEVMARTMKPREIVFNPELDIFEIDGGLVEEIARSMRAGGFDKSQPVVVWKGQGCVVDGRTRLKAALAAELAEIPVVEKEFDSLEDAVQYAYRRQAERRNLTQGEILEAAIRLGIKDRRDGTGRSREKLARDLGVSESTVIRARTVAKRGSEEDLNAIKKGGKSINQVYQDLRGRKGGGGPEGVEADFPVPDLPAEEPGGAADPPEGESGDIEGGGDAGFDESLRVWPDPLPEAGGEAGGEEEGPGGEASGGAAGDPFLPDLEEEEAGGEGGPGYPDAGGSLQTQFLRPAVILLCGNGQAEAAELLIKHFVSREGRDQFLKDLPDQTRGFLADLPVDEK